MKVPVNLWVIIFFLGGGGHIFVVFGRASSRPRVHLTENIAPGLISHLPLSKLYYALFAAKLTHKSNATSSIQRSALGFTCCFCFIVAIISIVCHHQQQYSEWLRITPPPISLFERRYQLIGPCANDLPMIVIGRLIIGSPLFVYIEGKNANFGERCDAKEFIKIFKNK